MYANFTSGPLGIRGLLVQQCPALRETERKVKPKAGSYSSSGSLPRWVTWGQWCTGLKDPAPAVVTPFALLPAWVPVAVPLPRLLSWVWDW